MVINYSLIQKVLGKDFPELKTKTFNTLGLVDSEARETLSFLDDNSFLKSLKTNSNITGLFTTSQISEEVRAMRSDVALYIVNDPRYSFYSLQNLITKLVYSETRFKSVIHPSAVIHPKAYVSEYNVIIGADVEIEPNVTILSDVEIGKESAISAGTVIGAEGFEHKRTSKGILSVKHDGKVLIGEKVYIGAVNGISKGFSYRNTIIGDETKTDNLVHIAHGVQIGKRCFLPASCMIAGSVTIGDDVWIGPNASISSQITIQNNAFVTIGSVVTKDVSEKGHVTGNFAIPHSTFLRILKSHMNSVK